MKPFYNIGYSELFSSFLKGRLSRVLLVYSLIAFSFLFVGTFFVYNKDIFIVLGLFVIAAVSMLPLRVIPWFGFFDMNTILTAYASMVYGLPAGLIVGTASLVGIINSGDVDNNLFFDMFASYIVAIVASLFALQFFVPVVTVLAIVYAAITLLFHKLFGTLDFLNTTWTITCFIWIMLFLYKIMPLIGLA